jgi:DNA-binding LacI/PurR family transcriptional regulator
VGKVTLQTIADTVGVSRMTVSNAFSRPDQLSASLRERILAAAQELGYVGPDPSARALARGSTGAVGVLLTDAVDYAFADEVAMTFLGAIATELRPTGLALTLLTASETEGRVPARDVAMDGALVYSCDRHAPALAWLTKRALPLVFVDQVQAPGIPSINVDDRGGARSAAQHLVHLGHRRIGILVHVVGGELRFDDNLLAEPLGHAVRERLLGWQDVLDANGIHALVVRVPHSPQEAAYEGAKLLLGLDEPPTAILCFSDVLAQAVVHAAQDAGLRVPDDLSVVGFDDSPVATRMRPSLTTVRQDFTAKGRAAASALTAAIAAQRAGSKPRARHLVLPAQLVVRDSTAPPRSDTHQSH